MQNIKIDIGQAIKEGFITLRDNPIILIPVIINAILWCVFYYFTVYAFPPGEAPTFIQMVTGHLTLPEYLFYFSLLSLIGLFLYGMVIRMVYVANKEEMISLFEEAKVVAGKYIFLLIASILVSLITLLGLIAIIIPGVFLSIKLIYFSYAMLIDDEDVIGSLKKSWEIIKGNWWRTFGLLMVFSIVTGILSGTIAMAFPVPIALVIDYIAFMVWGWMYSAFTIAYLQLTKG
ncbi:MAG: hypothetical protein PQ971_06525 [Methanobacterium sp.]